MNELKKILISFMLASLCLVFIVGVIGATIYVLSLDFGFFILLSLFLLSIIFRFIVF